MAARTAKTASKAPAMKVIYEHQGPVQQGAKVKMIVDIEGRRYQAWIKIDTSYRSQSSAEVQLFVPGQGFTNILSQPALENPKVAYYDALSPVQQGDMQRQNRLLPMLREGVVELFTLAHAVVNGAL